MSRQFPAAESRYYTVKEVGVAKMVTKMLRALYHDPRFIKAQMDAFLEMALYGHGTYTIDWPEDFGQTSPQSNPIWSPKPHTSK
jgi:hypothetical protein